MSRPNTATIQLRLDVRVVASLAKHYEGEESISGIIRAALYDHHDTFIRTSDQIKSTKEAVDYLDFLGLNGYNRNKKGEAKLKKQIREEEIIGY